MCLHLCFDVVEGEQENEEGEEDGNEEGTYFIDQSGHYYYQANSNQAGVMAVVSGVDGVEEEEEFVINPDGEDGAIDGDEVRTFHFLTLHNVPIIYMCVLCF